MLRWKTPIRNSELLVEPTDFQGNQKANKSMFLYIILVFVLAWAAWREDARACSKQVGQVGVESALIQE